MKKSEFKSLLREEISLMFEKLEFDEDKLNRLIQNDKFLRHMYKTKNGSSDPEAFFYKYVIGDDELEQEYIDI